MMVPSNKCCLFVSFQGDLKHSHFVILTVHDLGCNRKYLVAIRNLSARL